MEHHLPWFFIKGSIGRVCRCDLCLPGVAYLGRRGVVYPQPTPPTPYPLIFPNTATPLVGPNSITVTQTNGLT